MLVRGVSSITTKGASGFLWSSVSRYQVGLFARLVGAACRSDARGKVTRQAHLSLTLTDLAKVFYLFFPPLGGIGALCDVAS